MTSQQRLFLEQFDQPFRQSIINCCENISRQSYDVIILLARKAACLLTVLEDLGLVSLNGIVVSDRILMFNTEWLLKKRVAIIDDTIISGTTISKMIRQLHGFGVSNISVHAFCIDNSWFVDALLADNNNSYLHQSFMRVSHSVSIRFCRQIVGALSIIPRPYNIDFSINKTTSLSFGDFSKITECHEWDSIDTGTEMQRENGIDCLSLNFRSKILSAFYSTIGGDYSKVLFAKIRIFTKKLPSGEIGKELESKVVPYVMFNPIKTQFADNIICAIADSEDIERKSLFSLLNTNSSKMYFIQYYFAERLFIFWKSYLENMLGKPLEFSKDLKDMYLLFPHPVIKFFQSFHYSSKINLCPDANSDQFLYDNTVRGQKGVSINPYEIWNNLTTKFLNLYYNKELSSRRIVKRLSKDYYTDAEYKAVEKRLDDGPSLLELVRAIAPSMHDSFDIMLMLSTFLDNAIDKGVVVPITVDDGTYLYRGFRHGEEVIWGDMTDKLIALFFEGIFGKNGRVTMVRFEKLLVLFLKFGIRHKILEQFLAIAPPVERTRLICVRAYLFGEVAVEHEYDPTIRRSPGSLENEFNPILTNECKTSWTSTRYKVQRVLEKNTEGGKTQYILNFDNLYYKQFEKNITCDEASDLDENTVDKISELSEVFKLCIDRKLLSDDDLVVLTSCLHLNDNAASVGAELHIYVSEIDNLVDMVNSRLAKMDIDVPFLQSLRNYEVNKIWTAVNSGAFKYFAFKNHVAQVLIKDISEKLKSIDPRSSRDWRGIWREELEIANDVNKELSTLNDKMGLLACNALITLQYLHSLLYEILERNGANEKYLAKRKEIKKSISIDIDKRKYKNEDEKERLVREKNQVTSEASKWEKYVEKNIEKVKAWVEDLQKITHNSEPNSMASDVINNNMRRYSDDRILKNINEATDTLKDLKSKATQALEDHKMLTPKYGVVRPSVIYFSMLHLNILSDDSAERQKISMLIKRELNNTEYNHVTESGESTMALLRPDGISNSGRGYVICSRGRSHSERLLQLGCQILKEACEIDKKMIISFVPNIHPDGIRVYYNGGNGQYDRVYDNIDNFLPDNKEEAVLCIYSQDKTFDVDSLRRHVSDLFGGEFVFKEKGPDDKDVCGRLFYTSNGLDTLC